MTIEERKERFSKFDGCIGVACKECSYDPNKTMAKDCRELIHEDAQAIMKDMAWNEDIKEFEATIRPIKFETPLTGEDRKLIKELIREKTEVPDISAHFIQEINELCVELNSLAAVIGKMEQVTKGTDPVGKDDITDEDALIETIGVCVADVIEEAAAALVIPPSLKDKFPIDYPVNVKSIYYRKNLVRCDLSNLHEATDDILVHYGILKDDNFKIVAGHDGSRVRIDRENPRVEITITKMEEEDL